MARSRLHRVTTRIARNRMSRTNEWRTILDEELADRLSSHHGAQAALQGLLDGAPLPGKNNLGTRLWQRADRQSDYTALPNPIPRTAAQRQVAA